MTRENTNEGKSLFYNHTLHSPGDTLYWEAMSRKGCKRVGLFSIQYVQYSVVSSLNLKYNS